MKKNIIFIILIALVIIFFNYLYYRPKNYSISYQVDHFLVTEKYDKITNSYHFVFKKDNLEYETILEKKYRPQRKLITKINYYHEQNYYCLTNNLTEPLCYDGQEYIAYHLVPTKLKQKIKYSNSKKSTLIKRYQQTDIYNYDTKNYAIRNYRGFDLISEVNQKSVKLFNKDVYYIDIIAQVNNYLLIADYNQQYYFDRFYVIDIKKQKVKEWQIDERISFDSYILGVDNNSIFLVDRKAEKEYEIVPHKQKMREVGSASRKGTILINNEWQAISLVKLINKDYAFNKAQLYNYQLINHQLFIKYPLSKNRQLITNQVVDKILAQEGNTIYYLVGNQIFSYNIQHYEIKLLENPEWIFNNKNVFYVY